MPELPDLTVFAENLHKAVAGKKIAKAGFHLGKQPKVSPEELSKALVSSTITRVERVGKQVCFRTDKGDSLFVHLMLTGGFVLTTVKELDRIGDPVLSLGFSDGTALAVNDPKAWAHVSLNPKPEAVPDALSLTADYLNSRFQKKPKTLIKPFLLDQKLIGGIGNAYSDEILWRARISPKSEVGKLPPEAVDALLEAIPAVLNEATEYLRTHHPGMVAGEFREFLKVHQPSLKQSPTGARIIKEQLASKKTYYTEEQKLY